MKFTYLVIVFFLIIFSCKMVGEKEKKKSHILNCCKSHHCNMYTNDFSIKKDSIEVDRILKRRSKYQKLNKEYLDKLVFAKSTVKLVEVKGKFQDYEIHKYNSCFARIIKDTVEISINYNHRYSGMNNMEGRLIVLKYWHNDFKSEIIHFSDVVAKGRGFPKSKVYFDYLELNKENFERGDTICGKINIRAKVGKDRTQMIKGNFKTIIF